MADTVEPRMRGKYAKDVVPALMKKFGYDNTMQVPRLKTIVLNMGLGEAVANPKLIDAAVAEVTAITGYRRALAQLERGMGTVLESHAIRIQE